MAYIKLNILYHVFINPRCILVGYSNRSICMSIYLLPTPPFTSKGRCQKGLYGVFKIFCRVVFAENVSCKCHQVCWSLLPSSLTGIKTTPISFRNWRGEECTGTRVNTTCQILNTCTCIYQSGHGFTLTISITKGCGQPSTR